MRQTESLNQAKPGLKRSFGNSKLQITLTLTLGLIVSCLAIAFVSRAHNQPVSEVVGPVSTPVGAPSPSTTTAQTKPHELVTTVRFNLYDLGILPREVHVQKGLLAINIEDYSGGTTGLVVERETGNAPELVGRVERTGAHWRGRGEIRLAPGRYQVYMADRPANRALLVIEP
jgi:hypothetical protein